MIGQTISHYRISEEIGRGNMGVVYLAEDLQLGRQVAIKFLSTYRQTEPEAAERFMAEAKAASALDHSNISVIHEVNRTADGQLYMVMTYYPGGSVKERLSREPLSIGRALELMIEVTRGLAAAHAAGIIHRDLKPANVMLGADDSARIIDFGLAKLSDQITLTRTGSALGTVAYMSPEQVRGEDLDHRSDLFSLGIMLFELLTGHLPFNSTNEASSILGIIAEEPEKLPKYLDEIPPGLQYVVSHALAKHVDDRYQSATELLTDLKRLRDGQTAGLSMTTRIATLGRRCRRRIPARVGFGLLSLLAVVASAYLANNFGPGREAPPPAGGPRSYLVKPDRSGDQPTIQAAIDAAADGDTVLLADGIFTGQGNVDIRIGSRSLTVMSRSNDPTRCIIDCQGRPEKPAAGFGAAGQQERPLRFQGFTIMNCLATRGGAALSLFNSSPTIANCIFSGNHCVPGGNGTGGAVLAGRGSRPIFLDCIFENNRAADAGGAIHMSNAGGEVHRCVFRDNRAPHGGSAIFMAMSDVEITDCRFYGNSCGPGHWGSSLHFDRLESRGVVTNCTFAHDQAPEEVIFARRGAAPTLRNCVIAFNGPGVAVRFDGTPITLENCNIHGNRGGDWVHEIADLAGIAGNFSADPLFSNLPGDRFAVNHRSPCLPQNNHDGLLIGAPGTICAGGSVLTVPGDYPSIGAATAAAEIGDTVLVAAGTWNEYDLRLPGGMTLLGATGNPADVVIDAGQQGRVILCDTLSTAVRIEAITITGGLATGSYPHDRGGGVASFATSLEVNRCRIIGNEAFDGGGIFQEGGEFIHLDGCHVQGNSGESFGGGISGRNCIDVQLTDCSISDNRAGWLGGGMFLREDRTRITDCSFQLNLAKSGAAILSERSSTHLISSLFTGNIGSHPITETRRRGDIVLFQNDIGSAITSCTFTRNESGNLDVTILVTSSIVPVTRTIIHGDLHGSAIKTGGMGGRVDLACSNIFGNRRGDYNLRLEGLEGKNGNLSVDPMFVDPAAGDYRLQPDSPCAAAANGECGLIGAFPAISER